MKQRPRQRWTAILTAVAIADALLLAGGPASVSAAAPHIALAVTVSPARVADGGVFTVTGTVTPNMAVSGVRVVLEATPAAAGAFVSCAPAGVCSGTSSYQQWDFDQLSARTTVTAKFQINGGLSGAAGFLFALALPVDASCGCPGIVHGHGPVMAVSISRSPGDTLPGSVVHVVLRGTTSVGPVHSANLQVTLPPGLGDPTNINPSTAVWGGPSARYIDDETDISGAVTLSFDSVVTGSLGSTQNVRGQILAFYPWDIGSGKATLAIHVGPAAIPRPPTPKPTSTPTKATPKPTETPTARPSPTSSAIGAAPSPDGSGISIVSPSTDIAPSPTALVTSSASSQLANVASSSTRPGGPATSGSDARDSPGGGGSAPGGTVALVAVGLVAMVAGAAAFAARRRGPH